VTWVGTLLAQEGEYGAITAVRRASGASRPTLYAWREQARAALTARWTEPAIPGPMGPAPEVAILTLLLEAHASTRGIQTCLRALLGWRLSLTQIGTVIHEAETRAITCLARSVPTQPRALALDELYGNTHTAAYVSAVDAHGGAVWATPGPVDPDAESWTLVLWDLQERGLRWTAMVHDGGNAAGAACATVAPELRPQRDVWHVLHRCAVAQARLDRAVAAAWDRWGPLVAYEEARAAGRRPKGRVPTTTAAAQEAHIIAVERTAADLRYLTGEVRRLLAVVVSGRDGLLAAAARRAEPEAALALLAEVGAQAPADLRAPVTGVRAHLAQALDGLLSFAVALDPVHRDMAVVLGEAGVALVGWAWRHRADLGPDADIIVAGLPPAWRTAARVLLTAWDGATRASSPAETWHSLLRPHVAVHRTLTPGLLALIAVWHNHRPLPRGRHRGQTPLQVCGETDAVIGWQSALGYAPDQPRPSPDDRPSHRRFTLPDPQTVKSISSLSYEV
jgi:hypothetical protein